jgi:hypothetical protein
MLWGPEHGRRVSWAVKELQDEEKRQQDSLSFLHGNYCYFIIIVGCMKDT